MKTNLYPYSKIMSSIANEIEKDIVKYMKDNNIEILDLQGIHTERDIVYALIYNYDHQIYEEHELVAIVLDGDSLYFLTQPNFKDCVIEWSIDDIKDSFEKYNDPIAECDDEWNALFGEDISSVQTAYNLSDSLDYITA